MSNIDYKIFNFVMNTMNVRPIRYNNEAWFIASDVTRALGYSNSRDAIAKHVKRKDRAHEYIPTNGYNNYQYMNIISASGIYDLIFESHKPEAARYREQIKDILSQVTKDIKFIEYEDMYK